MPTLTPTAHSRRNAFSPSRLRPFGLRASLFSACLRTPRDSPGAASEVECQGLPWARSVSSAGSAAEADFASAGRMAPALVTEMAPGMASEPLSVVGEALAGRPRKHQVLCPVELAAALASAQEAVLLVGPVRGSEVPSRVGGEPPAAVFAEAAVLSETMARFVLSGPTPPNTALNWTLLAQTKATRGRQEVSAHRAASVGELSVAAVGPGAVEVEPVAAVEPGAGGVQEEPGGVEAGLGAGEPGGAEAGPGAAAGPEAVAGLGAVEAEPGAVAVMRTEQQRVVGRSG